MKMIRNIALLTCLLVLATSCFEITEDVSMNADGSGQLSLSINLSESRQSLVNYMKMDEVEGVRVPNKDEINQHLDQVQRTLRAIPGMSEVKVSRDFENFIFSVNSKFANVKALNRAINEVAETLNQTSNPVIKADNYAYTPGQFNRYFKYPLKADIYDNASFTGKYLLDTARLVSIYRFANPVKTCSNTKAIVSPSKKSVMLKATIAELAKGEVSLSNRILF